MSPAKPAVGYSGTPLPKKLGIKAGARVAVLDAPAGFELEGVPTVGTLTGAPFDVILAFATKRAALATRIAQVRAHMTPPGGFWLAFPKRASGLATEVTEHVARELALPTGLVDNKVCAIDATWTGLRFVIRVELR